MRVLLAGKNAENMNKFSPSEIEKLVKDLGFQVVASNPDVILSYGGDGTLLAAERQYPSLPKLPLRNSQFCHKCANHEDEVMLKKLLENDLKLQEYKKLETSILYKTFYALNDFVIRNSDPTHTIRFTTSASDQLLIGDGIVIATPFGSTGYFKSITGQTFDKGFGLAFNNTTEKIPPVFFKDSDQVTFSLIRGKATLSMDNNPHIFVIDEGSELVFKLSNQVAKIYEDTSLRCPNCQVIKG